MGAKLTRHVQCKCETPILRIETGFDQTLAADLRIVQTGCDMARKLAGHVIGQAEHLADLAQGAFRLKALDRCAECGPMQTVMAVDSLNNLFATIAFEIDIDIGRFLAIFGDEPLEKQA